MTRNLLLLSTFFLSTLLMADQIKPFDYTKEYEFLCKKTESFLTVNDSLDNGIIWANEKIEVAAISSSEFCGNLGCSAVVSFVSSSNCYSREINSVQTFVPISIANDGIQVDNGIECTSWTIEGNKIVRGGC